MRSNIRKVGERPTSWV